MSSIFEISHRLTVLLGQWTRPVGLLRCSMALLPSFYTARVFQLMVRTGLQIPEVKGTDRQSPAQLCRTLSNQLHTRWIGFLPFSTLANRTALRCSAGGSDACN